MTTMTAGLGEIATFNKHDMPVVIVLVDFEEAF